MRREQLLEQIVNELIQIDLVDYYEEHVNSQDKKTIDFKYRNNQTVNAIIKKVFGLAFRDWNDPTIIRDEVYCTVYDIMLNKVAPDFTDEQLEQIAADIHTKELNITHSFLCSIYKLAILKAKCQLSGHRRSSTGNMIPAADYIEFNEEALIDSPDFNSGLVVDNPDESISFFQQFFNENKENFLTRKQLLFIEDDSSVESKNKTSYKKRIYNRTTKAYEEYFGSNNDRLNEIRTNIKLIEDILESDDFVNQILKHRDKTVVNDALTEYVPLEVMRAFNYGYYSYDKVLKYYRIALFKQLNNLNQLLDEKQRF
jgi:hypothetical protein